MIMHYRLKYREKTHKILELAKRRDQAHGNGPKEHEPKCCGEHNEPACQASVSWHANIRPHHVGRCRARFDGETTNVCVVLHELRMYGRLHVSKADKRRPHHRIIHTARSAIAIHVDARQILQHVHPPPK